VNQEKQGKQKYVLFGKTKQKEKSKNGRKGKNRKSEREEWELE
jgi:hypothetical protein